MKKILCAMGFSCVSLLNLSADPAPDEAIKFQQLPMLGVDIDGTTYYGHDEVSTAVHIPSGPGQPLQFQGNQWMADDFADPFAQTIVHLEWWGSYLSGGPNPSTLFLIEFLSDDPVGDSGIPGEQTDNIWSLPLAPLYEEASMLDLDGGHPEPGEFTETLVVDVPGFPPGVEDIYRYNAHLHLGFDQLPDTVYWLKIVALVPQQDPAIVWGWHNRDYTIPDPFASTPPAVVPGEFLDGFVGDSTPVFHFQDDAVMGNVIFTVVDPFDWRVLFTSEDLANAVPQNYIDGVDGPTPIGTFSKDLAFVLYYQIPEPSTAFLALTGLAGVFFLRRRRS